MNGTVEIFTKYIINIPREIKRKDGHVKQELEAV